VGSLFAEGKGIAIPRRNTLKRRGKGGEKNFTWNTPPIEKATNW